ncbi:MAG: hypothetical protein ACYC7J_09060 [Syntrophales bacterium]
MKEYAFVTKEGGGYRFLIARDSSTVRVFIEGSDSQEYCLVLPFDDYLKMVDNFLKISMFLGDI